MAATHASPRRWLRRLLEVVFLLGFLLLSFFFEGLAEILQKPWPEWVALFLFAFLLLVTLIRTLVAFWRREWLGGIVRLLILPMLLTGGMAGLFVISIAGSTLPELWQVFHRTLPLEKGAERRLVGEGERIARLLSAKTPDGKPMQLRHVTFGLHPKGGEPARTVEYDFWKDDFSCDAMYRQEGSLWRKWSDSASGGEMFDANRKAVSPALPEELQGSFDWPVNQAVTDRLLKVGWEIAKVLEQDQPLASEGALWGVESIEFQRELAKGCHDSIRIGLQALREGKGVAWATADLSYDGESARLDRCRGSTLQGGSNKNDDAAVATALREWLHQDRGILKKAGDHGKPWRSCEATLPGGVRLIYHEQPAHPFLAEYNMRAEFLLQDGRSRCFELPMNTGGRTKVLAYTGITASGSPAVHLVASPHFDIAFDLGTLRRIDPKAVIQESYAGAFLGEKTPLTWFPAPR
ncbi:MAG: hypothetical protein WAN16_04800 [Chthoniobacterales bacterium]